MSRVLRPYHFSQNECRFANLYSINPGNNHGHIQKALTRIGTPGQAIKFDHAHSYWLKRLLLEVISQGRTKGVQITPAFLFKIFCDENDESSYHEDLIRLCVGEMTHHQGENLVRVVREADTAAETYTIRSIETNLRGEYCIHHFFDSFAYLQLIVDDYMLDLPNSLKDDFLYDKHPLGPSYTLANGYKYLVSGDRSEYVAAANRMVEIKSRLVTQLLAILVVSFECESERYINAFTRISSFASLPDPQSIKHSVFHEFESLRISAERVAAMKSVGKYRFVGGTLNIDDLENLFNNTVSRIADEMREIYEVDRFH